MTDNRNTGILLTEADCFMYTLEKHLIQQETGSSNVCRYLLELENKIDEEAFRNYIHSLSDLQWLASVRAEKPNWLAIPVWKKQNGLGEIPIHVHHTDEQMPLALLQQKSKPDEHQLRFDLLYRSNGNTGLVFSWHHLIMDGYGATLLLRQLASGTKALNELVDSHPKKILGIAPLANATRAKFFVDRISRKPLSSIAPVKKSKQEIYKIKTIAFTEDETIKLDALGLKAGSKFGRSALYLAASSRSIFHVLQNRGLDVNDFWVPVPKDLRKKGAEGPLLGNHTSFLFYRLKKNELESFEKTVQSINRQMVEQVKTSMSRDYDILMRYLRRTPTPLYYFWIKGPQGGSLASFLFTVAANHPDDFVSFQNHSIVDAWAFPSGIYPPGLGFAFMRFKNNLHIMVNYFEGVVSEEEINQIEYGLRIDLLSQAKQVF